VPLSQLSLGTVLAFVLTYFFSCANKENEESTQPAPQAEDNTKQNVTSEVIKSPLNGEVFKLADISDSVFASGALGKGVAIKPSEGKLISPVAGTVSALFETQHAIGIVTEHGAELLVHIGMDTVQLEGKFFNAHVAQGDKIEKGQLLIEFDIEAIEKAGYNIFTPVVITNFDQYTSIETAEEGTIQVGKPIIFLEK
jgi:beta-glucoside PTS system EIICBA component